MHKKNMYMAYLEIPQQGHFIIIYESDFQANSYNNLKDAEKELDNNDKTYWVSLNPISDYYVKLMGVQIILKPSEHKTGLYQLGDENNE